MQLQEEDDSEGFDADEELKSQLEDSKTAVRNRGNARAYEIRRRIEDLEESRRFNEIFEDLDQT